MKIKSSRIERLIILLIERKLGIKMQRQFRLKGKYYDGKYKNVLLEIDGVFWHRTPRQLANDLLKDQIAIENGYKIYRIKVFGSPAELIVASHIKKLQETFQC
jgi:very-short-patch-repair endonuclease